MLNTNSSTSFLNLTLPLSTDTNCPNYTGATVVKLSTEEKLLAILLYSTVAVVATFGNAVVIFIVVYFRRMRTVTNMFIANLAVSDILMAAMCIPFSYWPVLILFSWPFGILMCKTISFIKVLSVMLSAHTLVVISFDRFAAILCPLRKPMTWPIACACLVLIWTIDVGIAIPVLIVQIIKPHTDRLTNQTSIHCYEDWGSEMGGFVYSTLIMILQYFLPLLILVITYTGIGIKIWLSSVPGEVDKHLDRRRKNIKRKAILMMFMVSITYAVCWLPQNSLNVLLSLCISYLSHPSIYYIWWGCHFSAMCQSCVNPFIYFATSERFREGFRYVFQWCPFVKYAPKELLTLQQARTVSVRQSVTMSSNGRGNRVKLLGDALIASFATIEGSTGCDTSSNGGGSKGELFRTTAVDNEDYSSDFENNLRTICPTTGEPLNGEPSESDVLLDQTAHQLAVKPNGKQHNANSKGPRCSSLTQRTINGLHAPKAAGKVKKQVSFQKHT